MSVALYKQNNSMYNFQFMKLNYEKNVQGICKIMSLFIIAVIHLLMGSLGKKWIDKRKTLHPQCIFVSTCGCFHLLVYLPVVVSMCDCIHPSWQQAKALSLCGSIYLWMYLTVFVSACVFVHLWLYPMMIVVPWGCIHLTVSASGWI
jgi:hypothetical protein